MPKQANSALRALVCLCILSVGCSLFRKQEESYDPLATLDGGGEQKGVLGQLHPDNVVAQAKEAVGKGKDQDKAREIFEQADQLFKEASDDKSSGSQGQFQSAAQLYRRAAAREKSKLQEDSLFLAAESLFFAERYPQSVEAFAQLVKDYPNTRHFNLVDARRFAIARYWIEHQNQKPAWPVTPNLASKRRPVFDRQGHALRVLDQIRIDNPTGELADDATMLAAATNFEAKRYIRADELFDDLRRTFPTSDHQFNAHLIGLKAKMMLYQGADYDATALNEAERLLNQIRTQFPVEAQQHGDFLTRALKDVRMNLAMQEWNQAQYYDRRNEFGAAKRYYEIVRRNYPDTSLAEDASARLAKIESRPEVPPQRLSWLVDAFPKTQTTKPLIARNPAGDLR